MIFLTLLNTLCTKVYANMTVEAIEGSTKFYNIYKFLINLTQIISRIMELACFVFIIVIPIIILYKKIKLNYLNFMLK